MKTIRVKLKNNPYNIFIGSGIIKGLGRQAKKLKLGSDAYIITNAYLKNKYGNMLFASLKAAGLGVRFMLVADTEKSKSLASLEHILEDIARFDRKKKVFIIAFGGGVVGDLAGFVASVYKRGVNYIQAPTTLLAQVDSSIGGKTAVDLKIGKNLVGAFYQPKAVFSDLLLLKSLDKRQLQSGLAEVIKYGVIKDPVLFSFLERRYPAILKADTQSLLYIIRRSSLIKARIVEHDEKEEKGIRTILNFGHTLGHAIEAAGEFKKYNHGEAIALGMLLALQISKAMGLTADGLVLRVERLIRNVGLPVKIKSMPAGDIIKAHYRDKKFIGAKNRLVLVQSLGKTKVVENIPLQVIQAALKGRV